MSVAIEGSDYFGIPILTSTAIPDGRLMFIDDGTISPLTHSAAILVGKGEWTEADRVKEMATRIVRNGLAQWVRYIGQDVGPAVDDPIPYKTHVQVISAFKAKVA